LNIEKEILDDRQAKLTVTYTTAEFEGYKRRAAKHISKNVKIPGFRPGKAPYSVVLNHYGEGSIIQEAIDILLDADYSKILDEAEIEPSGVGNLEKIESYDPPTFVFMVPLEPIVNLGEYHEVRKPYELEEFDIKEVDEFIDNLRRNAATIVPVDRKAKEGDLVYFNLSGEFLNPAEDEDATITEKTPQQVVIPGKKDDEKESEWPYPGFAKALVGVAAGDSKELQHQYPEDYDDEEFSGKTAVFTVDVQSIKELDLPEFDEEFVKTMGDYETTDDLRKEIEERLKQQHQSDYDDKYFDELLTEITEMAEIAYPPQMLAHEEEHILEDIKNRLGNQNMDFETYLKLRSTDEDKFMESEVRPVAMKRLERSLITNKLIEQEGLKINQELLNGHINSVLNEVLYSGDLKEMQKQMGKEEFSRAITMEGVTRTMNAQLQERIKLIATGQPIPEEDETSEASEMIGDTGESSGEVVETAEEDVEIIERQEVPDVEEALESPEKQIIEEDSEEELQNESDEESEENK
jgi:trigger factor